MKTFKTRLFILLWGMLIPLLTANCSDKKPAEKAETTETAEATAATESVVNVAIPPFQKFVVVTVEEGDLLQKPDNNSPNLMRWIESDCESDFCQNIYQWSDQPGKPGFEVSTDIMVCAGKIFPVLGEEGDFYKVSTLTEWCDIEFAYLAKASVGDIECQPIKADMLESEDMFPNSRVIKDGKYKDVVFIDEYNELEGETLHVGVLKDGIVAMPLVYNVFSQISSELAGSKEGLKIKEEDGHFMLDFSKDLGMVMEDYYNTYQLNLKKLNAEQIAKIIDTVTKKKPEYVNFMYHFPAQGLESFIYFGTSK